MEKPNSISKAPSDWSYEKSKSLAAGTAVEKLAGNSPKATYVSKLADGRYEDCKFAWEAGTMQNKYDRKVSFDTTGATVKTIIEGKKKAIRIALSDIVELLSVKVLPAAATAMIISGGEVVSIEGETA